MAFPQQRPQAPQLPQHLLRTIECQQGAVRAVRFNADGNYLLTCGSDKSLRLWSESRGTLLTPVTDMKCWTWTEPEPATFRYSKLTLRKDPPLVTVATSDKPWHFHATHHVLMHSYDNSQLCSCSSDKTVILWDVASGQVTGKLRGHAGKVNCVQFNEKATVMLSGSIDGTVRCWDTRSRWMEPIQILDEARDGISSLKVSEHELLTGSVDGRVRRYDLRMGQLHVDFIGSPITYVCFSRDGQCTLSSSLDSTVRLLDKSSGEMLGEYSSHVNKGYKLDCCLSDKHTHVLSCSEDGHVYFWDLVEGSLTIKLPVGKAVAQSLSFHATDPCLLTAMERRVQVWGRSRRMQLWKTAE